MQNCINKYVKIKYILLKVHLYARAGFFARSRNKRSRVDVVAALNVYLLTLI